LTPVGARFARGALVLGLALTAALGVGACGSSAGPSDAKATTTTAASKATTSGTGAAGATSLCAGWARLQNLANQPPAKTANSYAKNLAELKAIAALMRKDPPPEVAVPATHFGDLIDQAARQLSLTGGESAVGLAIANLLADDQAGIVALQNWVAKNCPG
jgi:hypothetical protein